MKRLIMSIVAIIVMAAASNSALAATNGKSDDRAYEACLKAYEANEAGNYDEALRIALGGLQVAESGEMKGYMCREISAAYQGKKDKANTLEYLIKGLGYNPIDEELLYNLGVFYFDNNDYDKAARAFDRMIVQSQKREFNPIYVSAAYSYRGLIAKEKGEIRLAEEYLLKAVATTPDANRSANEATFNSLGDLYKEQGKYTEAIKYYEQGVGITPKKMSNIKHLNDLAVCYRNTNDNRNAYLAYLRCMGVYTSNREMIDMGIEKFAQNDEKLYFQLMNHHLYGLDAVYNLGLMTLFNNKVPEALEHFKYFINDDPDLLKIIVGKSKGFVYMAYVFGNQDETELYHKAIDLGLEVWPDNPDLLFCKALKTSKYDQAELEMYQTIIGQENIYELCWNDYATAYNNLAWCYRKTNRSKEGLPYAEKSVKMDPSHEYSWETLGEIYYEVGQYQKCIDAMQKCLSISTREDKDCYEYIGKAYIKLGKQAEGQKYLNKAKTM